LKKKNIPPKNSSKSFEKKGKNNEKNFLFKKNKHFPQKNKSKSFEKFFIFGKKKVFWGNVFFFSKKNSKSFEKKALSYNWTLPKKSFQSAILNPQNFQNILKDHRFSLLKFLTKKHNCSKKLYFLFQQG
jgi:hypothetical protein